MQLIDSRANPDILPAREYSEDGIRWQPIPEGIRVIGSRYAMILDEIVPGDLELPLGEFQVGVGSSRGRPADSYLRGRVDKACLVRAETGPTPRVETRRPLIKYRAKLLEPYAVMLR